MIYIYIYIYRQPPIHARHTHSNDTASRCVDFNQYPSTKNSHTFLEPTKITVRST